MDASWPLHLAFPFAAPSLAHSAASPGPPCKPFVLAPLASHSHSLVQTCKCTSRVTVAASPNRGVLHDLLSILIFSLKNNIFKKLLRLTDRDLVVFVLLPAWSLWDLELSACFDSMYLFKTYSLGCLGSQLQHLGSSMQDLLLQAADSLVGVCGLCCHTACGIPVPLLWAEPTFSALQSRF